MKVFIGYILLLALPLSIKAQENNLNILFAGGFSYFFNDNTLNRRIDNTLQTGVNYCFNKKGSNFIFNPGFTFFVNRYHSDLRNYRLMHVNQFCYGIDLDVMMKIAEKKFIRVGILLNNNYQSEIMVTQTDLKGREYYGYDVEALHKGYEPAVFQAALKAGVAFRIFKRNHTVSLNLIQYVSRIVENDFILDKSVLGVDRKILSIKARPLMIRLALELNLKKKKKKKDPEE